MPQYCKLEIRNKIIEQIISLNISEDEVLETYKQK
jgi:hypothetical protein